MIGQKINRYEIKAVMNRGLGATNYLAYDTDVERQVKLTIFDSSHFDSEEKRQQFLYPIYRAVAFEHSHMPYIYLVGEYGDTYYVVSRYIEGATLAQIAKAHQIPASESVSVIMQIASALEYAHQRHAHHYGVTPDNIMIDKNGDGFLMEISAVVLRQMDTRYSASLSYIPPEFREGKLDNRTDIYMLGATAFYLFTGEKRIPKTVASFYNPDLPPELDRILEKALEKDPDKRYQSANQFAHELVEMLPSSLPKTLSGWVQTILDTPTKTHNTKPDKPDPSASSIPFPNPSVPSVRKRTKHKIFISYRKLDRAIVHPMKQAIESWDNVESVWMDTHLEGGQHWWDTILEQIREADIIITALSDEYLDSIPCQREYTYALTLGKTMLPVRVGTLDYNRVAKALVQIQMIDCIGNTPAEQTALQTAIRNAPMSPDLPDPLPTPPDVPLSVLVEVEELANQANINRDGEDKIFVRLFELINGNNDDERQSAVKIIAKLRARQDISRGFYDKLESLNSQSNNSKGLFGIFRNRRNR